MFGPEFQSLFDLHREVYSDEEDEDFTNNESSKTKSEQEEGGLLLDVASV